MTIAAVAISGGVDSLVSAYLMKAAGHAVIGVHFLTGFEDPPPGDQSPHPIHAIGDQLGIPVHVIDLSADFRQRVVAYFTATYQAGQTPNPCLQCNPVIKFGRLWTYAADLGADCLATGHYARIACLPDGRWQLLRGIDPHKDQSYFLARLRPSQLARTRFPLGGRLKSDVRRLAADAGLTPLTTAESQDVCFIRQSAYHEFVAEHTELSIAPGPIVDTTGKVVGEHQGLHRFTVGQRRGIDCPASQPYYVVRLEPEANRLVVGFRAELARRECLIADVNWIRPPVRFPFRARVRIRYRHRAAEAELSSEGANVRVRFAEPQEAITPGQGGVFYDGDEVRGGGWIV
jgi:tRNA-specific 2-thiouridylase